jgi:hypothetical protein
MQLKSLRNIVRVLILIYLKEVRVSMQIPKYACLSVTIELTMEKGRGQCIASRIRKLPKLFEWGCE